jgi:CRISPR/Cas system-associated exonuclease Cas4 (RecB family)
MPYSHEYLRALGTALNWALVPKARREPPGIRVAFWASDAFICRRRLGLQFMEVPRDPLPPKTREVTKWGDVIHAEYLDRLRHTPGLAVLGHEQRLDFRLPGLDFPFRGKYDFLVEGHPKFLVGDLRLGESIPPVLQPLLQRFEPVRFLIDVKSATSFAVSGVAEQGARLADRAELTLYEHAAGVDLGFLLYHDKQSCRREVIPVLHDEAFLLEIRDWFASVAEEISVGRIPDAEYDPAVDEYPCGSCPFRSFCSSVPNRVPLARSAPTPEQMATAEATLADAAERLAPVRETLAAIVAPVDRVQLDGISAPKPWHVDPVWDITRLAEIFAAYGFTDLPVEPAVAERLVRDGRLPASVLADAKRPRSPDQIVLRV